ncbi:MULTISPECIES: C40 family peptidase [unclassified Micromonospora]|uniref:C40 family peptidase n=1 Tax=unclassified Micromonospora TaxID=2617518 RepID=UPI00098D630D|nr:MULTISPECIES: NlpC/P60 family protein [unclassified Micromonospora]MDI5938436.1 NlpC/P60 family protein [Micromonospora sp. DH15]
MTRILIGVVTVVTIACLGLPTLLLSSVLGNGSGGCDVATAPAARPSGHPARSVEQLEIAAAIIDVGVAKGVPRWGWVVAVATAMQESGLRNLPHLGNRNDHDSIGVFQQRPSQGWGTVPQLSEPSYQAGKFFDKLLTVPGWESMPLTQAAQAVQVSAYPDAYAKWTDDATVLVDQLTSTLADCPADAIATLPDGLALPADNPPTVATAILWAIDQLGTPHHFGGSCTDPHSGEPAKQCDYSSLIQDAYQAADVPIPGTTTDQARSGKPVGNLALLLPGDLIFIPGSQGSIDNPRHVGMYLGEELIIHTPKTGDTVKITRLSNWLDKIATIQPAQRAVDHWKRSTSTRRIAGSPVSS